MLRFNGGSHVNAQALMPGFVAVAGCWMCERHGVEWQGISMPTVRLRVEAGEREENSWRRYEVVSIMPELWTWLV